MKKCYLYAGMLAAGMLAFSACSNDDDPIPSGGQENAEVATGKQVIVLDMQDTDVLATKSRPLYSTTNQGAELVTDVKLLVFKHASADEVNPMTLDKVLTISQWDQNSSDYSYGRKYSYELKGTEKLENGASYTIVAVGQDESDTDATTFAPYQIVTDGGNSWISALTEGSWTTNTTWNAASGAGEGFLKTVARTDEDKNEAEIFSGISKPVTLTMDGAFTAEVLLKRQVAGVLGYFDQIPAIVPNTTDGGDGDAAVDYYAVKKIRLVASAKNTQLDLTYALSDQKDDATEVGDEFAVNGFKAAATADAKFMDATTKNAYTVYEIDLTKWFTSAGNDATDATFWYGDAGTYSSSAEMPSLGDEFVVGGKNPVWVNALDQANSMPRVATNSVLAGEFVIPFNKNVALHTFELQLIGGTDNNTVLKKWDVKLDEMSLDETRGDNEYAYNIYRNHLYQIGQRGGGDNPVNPGEDPDDPQPLDKAQELTIKINDNWEFIHDMVIE